MTEQRWEFEDDRQNQVVLTERPRRVLAYAQAAQTLVRLGVPVVGYFGSQHQADSGAQHAAAGLDVPSVGAGDTIDQDLIATLQPDLVVTVTYAGETYGLSQDAATKLAESAPILLIAIAGDRTLESVIARFHQLAHALSATTDDPVSEPQPTDSETDLTAAIATLTSATSDQPTLRVTALSGGTETDAYVANPAYWPSLRLLANAGVTFTETTTTGGWEVVEWTDLAANHPADIVLYDQRPNSLPIQSLTTIPTWPQLPAGRSNTILPWNPEPPLTYEAAASFANDLTDAYRG